MRVFGGERMQGLMDRLRIDEDVPLESKMVDKQIESAQARVEGHNFDTRRHVVEYDDVMNKQREIIYGERRKILEGIDTKANLQAMVEQVVGDEVPHLLREGRHRDTWDWRDVGADADARRAAPAGVRRGRCRQAGRQRRRAHRDPGRRAGSLHHELEEKHGPELMRRAEQAVMLQVIDQRWRTYLTQMEQMREQIGFHGYGRWTR